MRKTLISIVQGDITKRSVDAIVNAANGALPGGGGVDGAIHDAAGHAKVTKAYRITQAKWIIHAVGPIFGSESGQEANLLASCYNESLRLAVDQGCRSIAFPSISTGAFGYPIESASHVALSAIRDYLAANPDCLDLVEIATFSRRDCRAYQRVYRELFAEC